MAPSALFIDERRERPLKVARLAALRRPTLIEPQVLEATPVGDRRRHPRYPVPGNRLLAIPLRSDGQLDWNAHAEGRVVDVSASGIGLEFDKIVWPDVPDWLVCVVMSEGDLRFTGIQVRNRAGRPDAGQLRVGGLVGGRGSEILMNASNVPMLSEIGADLSFGMPDTAIESWIEHGVLEPVPTERVLLCPQCRALPTFRRGCACCGSSRVSRERLIHHFRCAHVGRVGDFEDDDKLVCPKCRGTTLVVGADYEYLDGPFVCGACRWSGTELELVGQCPRCSLRFPEYQAHEQELRGFRVNRLDPLALVSPH